MDLKELENNNIDPDSHWYYQSKADAMLALSAKCDFTSILDVGAGSGFFSKVMLQRTNAIDATCLDIGYVENSVSLVGNKRQNFCREIKHSKADLILMMDVLEHIKDDVNFLKDYIDKCPSGSSFLISVPAFNFMWSDHDVFLKHYRRYTLGRLLKVVKDSGLKPVHSSYYFGFVFIIPLIIRMFGKLFVREKNEQVSQMRNHGRIVNFFLRSICKVELQILKYNKLVGLSIFCIARKP